MGLSEAGKFLADFNAFLDQRGYPKPHLHVSDSIPDARLIDPNASLKDFFLYTRVGNHPDHLTLERWLADFEDGAAFRLCATGMNAVRVVLRAALQEQEKRHVILVRPLYGGTDLLGKDPEEDFPSGSSVTYLSASSPVFSRIFEFALRWDTAAVFCEIPGNPTYAIPDIQKIRHILNYSYLRASRPTLIVDNTSSLAIVHPFKWGADVIAASGTKYLSGESAWVLGYCGVSREFLAERPAFWEYVTKLMSRGGTAGLLESYITGRFSVLDVNERVTTHSRNALAIAQFLEKHPAVDRVIYPGLPSYLWRDLADKYFEPVDGKRVYGGMLACYLRGADLATTNNFLLYLDRQGGIPFKASFGGPRTMAASPMLLTHRGMSAEAYASCGVTPNLIRISAGREDDPGEIIEPLAHSLDALRTNRLPSYQ